MITRGYPFIKKAGERVDHPHHVGMWLNYESVNGFDFGTIQRLSKTVRNTELFVIQVLKKL
jgi:hypothetical protein